MEDIIEVDPNGISYCRCCYTSYFYEEMENIFDCLYDRIELHEIVSLLVPVSISADDGELCLLFQILILYSCFVFKISPMQSAMAVRRK